MGNGLCVGGNRVVFFIREIDVARAKGSQDILDELQRLVRGTMFDQDLDTQISCCCMSNGDRAYQWLIRRRDGRAV